MDVHIKNKYKCASNVELLLTDWHSWCHTDTYAFKSKQQFGPYRFQQSNLKTTAQIVHYSIWIWPNCWRITVLFNFFFSRYASLIQVIKLTYSQWNSIVEIVCNDFKWKNFCSHVCKCVRNAMSNDVCMFNHWMYSLVTRWQVVSKVVIKLYLQTCLSVYLWMCFFWAKQIFQEHFFFI